MKVVKIATAAALTLSLVGAPLNVLADQQPTKGSATAYESNVKQSGVASVTKFSLYGNSLLSEYDKVYKMANGNITKVTPNGGNYPNSPIAKATDGNMSTHWETNRPNSATFKNEVTFNFDETTLINRIVYAARQDGAKGKGFAQEFEIYGSTTDTENDFKLVTTGSYSGSINDIVEIQFEPTEFKRLKFVYKKAHLDFASASEFQFYKEDPTYDKVSKLFTDSKRNTVSEEFNSIEALDKLEQEALEHPLYSVFKEDIDDAKAVVLDEDKEVTKAATQPFSHFSNEGYSNLFKMDRDNIKSIKNNGGRYMSQFIENSIDGNLNTYWETGKGGQDFKNEVELEFKDAEELNRIVYGARPDRKGFATEFEIYASPTSKGDTYKLLTTGKHPAVGGLVEAKFEPTKIKRVKFKFKQSTENWATLSELAFYKEDALSAKVDSIFTDGTMSEISSDYNSVESLNKLDEEVKNHPLYASMKVKLDLAKEILKNPEAVKDSVWSLERRGDSIKESQKRRIWNFQDWQPTGVAVKSGQKINVFVDVAEGSPTPKLVFKQMDSKHNGNVDIPLSPGMNTITIPERPTDEIRSGVAKAGVLYTVNPYTAEEQGREPKIRIDGAYSYPHFIKGVDNDEEVLKELEEYVEKLKTDSSLTNAFEVFSDKGLVTVEATYANKWFKDNPTKKPSMTADKTDDALKEAMKFWGFDGSSEINSDFNFRYVTMFKYLDGGGAFMNANNGITGIRLPQQGGALDVDMGWGFAHEMGHNFDTRNRLIVESSNNMLSLQFQRLSGVPTKITVQNEWENRIYSKVALEDYSQNTLFPGNDYMQLSHITPLWQLSLYDETFYPKFEQGFRSSSFTGGNRDQIHQEWIKVASDAMQADLTEHFARHGLRATEATAKYVSKYSKPTKKLWYANDKMYLEKGGTFTKDVNYSVSVSPNSNNQVTLNFEIDNENIKNTTGYEIKRDGKIIGFTSKNTFVDKTATPDVNHTYEIIAYDKELNEAKPVKISAFTPAISVEDNVTLKLHEEFNPMDYVKAFDHKGQDITQNVTIKSNTVEVSKKGNYEVVYEIKSAGEVETKTMKVSVISDYVFASDMTPTSSKVGWGQLQKDKSVSGGTITLLGNGLNVTHAKGLGAHANSEIVYNLEGKDFNYFESNIGIDQAMKGKPSSATFEVWVDGEKKFSSKVFNAGTEREFIRVPVEGAKEVKLVTTDANSNSNASDHTVWADAKFTTDSSKPTFKVSDEVTFVKLNSDFDVMQGVEATDIEDGNLNKQVKVTTNGFNINKAGMYTVEYSVTDSDDNTVTMEREIYVYSEAKYASDTDWKSAQTDYKTVNKDKSSLGETIKLLVDGETKEFAKGIGTHANSEIVYDIEGKNYDYFETLVGVDRNLAENNNSSVVFKVLADGVEVFNSGVMKYNTEAKSVLIPVKGVKELKLIANDANNGVQADHADFANAKFYISNGIPQITVPKSTATKVGTPIDINEQFTATDAEDGDLTENVKLTGLDKVNFDRAGKYEITYTVTDSDGNEVTKTRTISVVNMDDYHYLSDFDWKSTQNSYTAPLKDKAISGKTLRLTDANGKEVSYEKGIGAHSTSTIIYDLTDKDGEFFTSFVGVDRQMYGSVGSVAFQVFVDGVKQYDSGLMNSKEPQKSVEVNISGAKELKLVVTNGGNGDGSDHATWADAKLHFADAERLFTQDLVTALEAAKAINVEDYTSESMAALQASIVKAEEILANNESTQSDIDQAVEMLKQAKEGLVSIDMSQIIEVPDALLNASIKQTLGITGEITLADMTKLTSLTVTTSRTERVTNLEGLQYAKNLETLDIAGNEVTDFSPLQGLEKLENLIANPQVIEMSMPTGQDSIFNVENLVKGLDGKHVNPTQIGLRHNQTFKEVVVDVDQLEANADQFMIDLTEEDKGLYTLVMVYEVEGNSIQIMSMIDNN